MSLVFNPLLRGGEVAPIKQMERYRNLGATGEVKPLPHDGLTSLEKGVV